MKSPSLDLQTPIQNGIQNGDACWNESGFLTSRNSAALPPETEFLLPDPTLATTLKLEAGVGKQNRAKEQSSEFRGRVTEKDQQALRWIAEQGIMTVDQLWRGIWKTGEMKSSRYAYLRVQFLSQLGWIKKGRSPYLMGAHCVLTKKGASFLAGTRLGSCLPVGSVPVSEILHFYFLTEARLRLTELNRVVSWKTDRVMAVDPLLRGSRIFKYLPDALWTDANGIRTAIEYERSRKGKTRLKLKVDAFALELIRPDRLFDQVLWIAEAGPMQDLRKVLGPRTQQILKTPDEWQNGPG